MQVTGMNEILHRMPKIDFTSKTFIENTAALVWEAVRSQIDPARDTKQTQDGRPGHLWPGSQRAIILDLVPECTWQISKEDKEIFLRQVNLYLRDSGVMICRKRAARRIPAVWWVSDHWTGLKVTRTETPDPASEPDEEIAEGETTNQPDAEGNFPCRECGRLYNLHHVRVGHERREHLLVVHADGTRETLVESKITDGEIRDLIALVAMDAKEPETLAYFFRKARELDSRVPRNRIHRTVLDLADDPNYPLVQRRDTDQYLRFEYREVNSAESAAPAAPIAEPLPARQESAKPVVTTSVSSIINDVTTMLQTLRDAEAYEAEIHLLHEKIEEVTRERDTARSELEEVTEQLRDNQKLLDTIRSQILGSPNHRKE